MENIQKKIGKTGIFITIFALVLVVILALSFFVLKGDIGENLFSDTKVVASVNGEEILGKEVNNIYKQVLESYSTQGVDLFDAYEQEGVSKSDAKKEVTNLLVEQLITDRLIVQYAESQGFTATEEMIDSNYDLSITQIQGEENFMAFLTERGLTTDEYRSLLSDDIVYSSFVNERFNAEEEIVSEEEIQTAYDQFVALYNQNGAEEDLPALSEVREEVVWNLKQQKVQQKFFEFSAGLREEAQVEIFI